MREGTTGLYYMRARYYDSMRGRFLSRDPIETAHPLTVNPYHYAGNNPVMYTDPLGTNSHTNDEIQASDVVNSALTLEGGLGAAPRLDNLAESGVRTYEAIANATSNPELRKAMQEKASRLKNLSRGLKAAGAAGTLAGAYNEGMKMDKAQKEAIVASQTEAQRIMESWQRDYDVLDGKLKRKEITRAEYLEAKVAADKFWQNQLEANANRGFNEVMLETVTGGLRALWQTTGAPTPVLNKYLNWLMGEE